MVKVSTEELQQFIGTEKYHRLNNLPIFATDGVTYFCEKAEAFWLFDEMSLDVTMNKDLKNEGFIVCNVEAKNEEATITYEDGNYNKLYEKKIDFTTLDGDYKFYIIDCIILLPSEY